MGSLLEPTRYSLTAAQARLDELRRRARGSLGLAAAALTGVTATGMVAGWATAGVVALGAGTLAALAVALLALTERRRLLLALVTQGDASSLAEVRVFAERLCSPAERAQLAGALHAAAEAGRTGAHSPMLVDPARADEFGHRLRDIADALTAPGSRVSATAIALCRRLLSEAAISPLYNPRLPAAELGRVLALVEREIAPEPAAGPAEHVA